MVQTKKGAAPGGNPWIDYMRVCAANYRAGHMQHHSVEGRPTPVKRRVTGKQPESTISSVAAKSLAKSMPTKVQGKQKNKNKV